MYIHSLGILNLIEWETEIIIYYEIFKNLNWEQYIYICVNICLFNKNLISHV